jgi:hypothetical protein
VPVISTSPLAWWEGFIALLQAVVGGPTYPHAHLALRCLAKEVWDVSVSPPTSPDAEHILA